MDTTKLKVSSVSEIITKSAVFPETCCKGLFYIFFDFGV